MNVRRAARDIVAGESEVSLRDGLASDVEPVVTRMQEARENIVDDLQQIISLPLRSCQESVELGAGTSMVQVVGDGGSVANTPVEEQMRRVASFLDLSGAARSSSLAYSAVDAFARARDSFRENRETARERMADETMAEAVERRVRTRQEAISTWVEGLEDILSEGTMSRDQAQLLVLHLTPDFYTRNESVILPAIQRASILPLVIIYDNTNVAPRATANALKRLTGCETLETCDTLFFSALDPNHSRATAENVTAKICEILSQEEPPAPEPAPPVV